MPSPLDELGNYKYHFTRAFDLLIRAFRESQQEELVSLLSVTKANFNASDSMQSFVDTIKQFIQSLSSAHQNAFGVQTMSRIRSLFFPGKNSSEVKIPSPSHGLDTLCTKTTRSLVKAVLAQPGGQGEIEQVEILINRARKPPQSGGSALSSQRGSPDHDLEEADFVAAEPCVFHSGVGRPPRAPAPANEHAPLIPKGSSDDGPRNQGCCGCTIM